jgi:hypothetical protein
LGFVLAKCHLQLNCWTKRSCNNMADFFKNWNFSWIFSILSVREEQRSCDGQRGGTRRSLSELMSLKRWVRAAHARIVWPIPTNLLHTITNGFQKVCPCWAKMAATSHGKAWTSAVYSPPEAGCPPPPCFLSGVPVTVKVQVVVYLISK